VIAPVREAQRKALHLTTTVVPLALAGGLPQPRVAGALAGLVVVALVVEAARRTAPAFGALFDHLVGSLLREHEQRHALTGATWLLLALALATALLPRDAAIAATWAAGVGDALAALVGRAWRRRHPGTGKTFAGSLACALGTAAGAALVAGYAPWAALAIGAGAALAERPTVAVDDNLRVATGAAVVALLV
jgi:dolichol kinase